MRIAWFQGDAQQPGVDYRAHFSQDAINQMAEARLDATPTLRILLIPDDAKLTDLRGDDFNDAPADCNASEPYTYPEGSEWVELRLGDTWPASGESAAA